MTTSSSNEEFHDVPADWVLKELGQVALLKTGGSAPQGDKYFKGGRNPFIRVQHFDGTEKYLTRWDLITDQAVKDYRLKLFKKDTILFPKSGASIMLEKRAKLPFDAYVVSHLCCIEPIDIESDFLFYLLKFMKFAHTVDGSTLPYLNLNHLAKRPVPIPLLSEQQRIAYILTTVQTAIEQQTQLIALRRELKAALMRKLFTEGLRGEKQKETEIGIVPGGWDVVELGEVINFFNGYAFKSKEGISFSNTQLVRMGNLYQNKLDLTRNPIYYPDNFAIEYSRYLLKTGDLVMSLTGTTGKEDYGFTVEVKPVSKTLLLNQRIARLDMVSDRLTKDFVLYFLLSRKFLDQLYPTAKGMKQANLSTHAMKKLKVLIPSRDEQKEISQCFRTLDKEIELDEQKKVLLEDLFRTLLHQLMTGQVRVNELDM